MREYICAFGMLFGDLRYGHHNPCRGRRLSRKSLLHERHCPASCRVDCRGAHRATVLPTPADNIILKGAPRLFLSSFANKLSLKLTPLHILGNMCSFQHDGVRTHGASSNESTLQMTAQHLCIYQRHRRKVDKEITDVIA